MNFHRLHTVKRCPADMPLRERLLAYRHVNDATGCWEWIGAKDRTGYGNLRFCGRLCRVHRLAYAEFVGPIGTSLVLHRCDNRICFNPDHLFIGTAKDNTQDMMNKGRNRRGDVFGEKHGNAKLTDEAVKEIRASYVPRSRHANLRTLAEKFGVDATLISLVIKRKIWRHVDEV
jgi:hypothetical protein